MCIHSSEHDTYNTVTSSKTMSNKKIKEKNMETSRSKDIMWYKDINIL